MAKVTITFTDEEDGSMHTSCEFDPPLEKEDRESGRLTVAQRVGAEMLQALIEMQKEL